MITVFFDDKCGLCSKEIAHYKKIASNEFEWIPISTDKGRLKKYGIETVDALKLLHVVEKDRDHLTKVATSGCLFVDGMVERKSASAFLVKAMVTRPMSKPNLLTVALLIKTPFG